MILDAGVVLQAICKMQHHAEWFASSFLPSCCLGCSWWLAFALIIHHDILHHSSWCPPNHHHPTSSTTIYVVVVCWCCHTANKKHIMLLVNKTSRNKSKEHQVNVHPQHPHQHLCKIPLTHNHVIFSPPHPSSACHYRHICHCGHDDCHLLLFVLVWFTTYPYHHHHWHPQSHSSHDSFCCLHR